MDSYSIPKSYSKSVPVEVADLAEKIGSALPGIRMAVEPGGVILGNWWITLQRDGDVLVVEWRPVEGIGVYNLNEEGYGVGPESIFADATLAVRRVVEVLSAAKASQISSEAVEPVVV